jgi:hypothetical protein
LKSTTRLTATKSFIGGRLDVDVRVVYQPAAAHGIEPPSGP